jgi:type IV secretory pathway VirB10-like protein
MRAATAFFAGVGTVVAAIGAGLGGGLLLGDIMSPQQPKHQSSEVTRLEQRSSPQPIPAMNGASQPVPYMAAPQVAATVGEASAQPQQQQQQPRQAQPQQQSQQQPQQTQQQQPQQAQPQVQQASTAQSAVAAAPPAANAEPSAARAAPDDSFAKARDADIKRDGRRADDRRKADRRQQWGDDRRQWDERRQQWVDKRKWRDRGNDDLGDVEASVRDATEPRSFFGREQRYERREPSFESRGPSFGTGRFSLFDD